MILTPAQAIVARDTHRFRVLDTGRRFGKTTLAVEEIKGEALAGAEKIVYIAPTYQQARDIVWATLKREMLPIVVGKPNESRLEMFVHTTKGTQCQIMLRGWEAIETLRGQAIDFIVPDEVAMYRNFWRIWQEVIRPCLTDRKGRALFISTPKGFNHFYDLYNMQEEDTDFKSFQFTTYDNPHIPVEEIEKAKQELTEDRFYQEYMADFRKMEGLVYKEFDREKHVFDADEFEKNQDTSFTWLDFIVGADYGFVNPSAVLSLYRDSTDCFYLMDESYVRGRTDPETNDVIAALKPNKAFPDPAAAGAIADLKKKGVNVREVVKGKDSIKNGIDRVRELFKADKLKIASRCVNTIQELETYSYPDKKPGHNEYEDPIKENDHACFTGDTLISTLSGKRSIKDIKVGDLVITPAGHARVLEIGSVGKKQVVPFVGNDMVTPNHPIATRRGFVRMDTLRYDDYICEETKYVSMESNSRDTLMPRLGLNVLTISLIQRMFEARLNGCTSMYGKKPMDQFLMAVISIIPMVIRLITNSQTWNVSPAKNTIKGIAIASLLKLKKDVEKTLDSLHAHLLVNGTDHLLESNSTSELEKNLGREENQTIGFAISAGMSTIPISLQEADSAEITAKQKLYASVEEVFNLKTEHGMYFADGVLVSNCDALRYAIMMTVTSNEGRVAHQFVPRGANPTPRQMARGGPDVPMNQTIPTKAHQYRPRFGK